MEGGQEMMTDSLAERGQSEPPPITGCVDLLSDVADQDVQNINKSHEVQVPEESPTTYYNEHHCGNILKVLKQQQIKAELCDTVLIANDRHIPVHSCVIAANSPYFKALFDTSDRIPGQPVQISLPTTSSEVADNLIGYMYSGDISITIHCVEELLQLTNKLMMDDVRQCCELHMIKFLDLTNWSSSQVLAKAHAFQDLATEIIKFLAQNLMIIKSTAEFPGLLLSDVIEILKQSNTNDGSDLELCKLEFLLNWILFDLPNNISYFGELLKFINPQLLSTEGVNKIFSELTKQELCEHELSMQLKSQVVTIEKSKAAEEAKEEELAKQAAEEETWKVIEAEVVEAEARSVAEEATSTEEIKKEDKAVGKDITGTTTVEKANLSNVVDAQNDQTKDTDEGGEPPIDKGEHIDSDTEVEDNGGKHFESNSVKEGKDKKIGDNNKSSQVGQDGSQYLEDGTLIVQPESAWQGRGKRKSYRPKKIHSGTGRPRGRPRKHLNSAMQEISEGMKPSTEVVQRPKRRGRPPLKGAHIVKKIRVKTHFKEEDDLDDALEMQDTEEQELDSEDKDPEWTPVDVDIDVEANNPEEDIADIKIQAKRSRKRKAVMIAPILKEKKKRGRKPNPGDKTYYCDKCPRTFKAMGALSHHMKGHGSDTPMLCEICGFSTRHYGSMNVHQRKHAGKVMRCPYEGCDHTEVHRARLDDHISAVHHGVKRHMCSICGKSFGAKKHLQRHEGLHGRAKDIACNICNYSTNRTDKLREHIRRHHPVVAVDMGMLKPEDLLNKSSAPKPRTPKKPKEPKEPKQPRKKKGSRYDIHSYSEVENATEELEKKEAVETVTAHNVAMVTNQPVISSAAPPPREQHISVQSVQSMHHSNQPVIVQMANAMPTTNIAPPPPVSHSAPIGVSNIPSHLLGTTTLSEEMIQYLASYTTDQIHMHNANQGPNASVPTGVVPVQMEHQPTNQQPAPLLQHPHHQHHPPWTGNY